MYQDKYHRNWNGPFPLSINQINIEAPAGFGVYQVLKKNGGHHEVMYIGIATGRTIRQRLQSHCDGSGNKNIAAVGNNQLWFVYWVCDEQSARQIESHVISMEKPPFNVKNEYKNYIPNITVH